MTQYPPTPAFGVFTWPTPKAVGPLPSTETAPSDAGSGRAHSMNPADNTSGNAGGSMVLRNAPVRKILGQNMEESDSTEEGELSDGGQTSDRAFGVARYRQSGAAPRDQDIRPREGVDSDEPPYSSRYNSQQSPRLRSSSPPDSQFQLNKGYRTDKMNRSRNGNARGRGARPLPAGHSNINQGDRGFDPPSHPRGGRQGDRGRGGGFPRSRDGILLTDTNSGSSATRNSAFGVGDIPPRGPRASLPSRQNSGYLHASNGHVPYSHPDQILQPRRDGPRPTVYAETLAALKDLHSWSINFHDIAAETGSSIAMLRKLYKELHLAVPAQLPPPPSSYNDQQQFQRPPAGPASTMANNPDEEARKIREKLERSLAETKRKNEAEAKEKERKEREKREAEAAAREKERREREKEEEDKRKQLEVEAKRDILRKKLEVMNLAGKPSPTPVAVTPISSTPVQFAALHHPPPSNAIPSARIPGLLMNQQDIHETAPTVETSQNGNVVMTDAALPLVSSPVSADLPSVSPSQSNGISVASSATAIIRRKRPVAADSFTDYSTPKRRFGTQTSDPLIIEASEDEDDVGTTSSQQSRGKTAPPSATPITNAVTTQAEELDKKIRALKAEIEAKNKLKRKAKNGTSAAPTPSATPPVRMTPSVPPSRPATAVSVGTGQGGRKPLQTQNANVTEQTTADDTQREKEKTIKDEATKHMELEEELSKAENEKRAISEKESQKKQQEMENNRRDELEQEEKERQRRLREIEEKFEARKKAMLEMQKEMEELEASRRALSQELQQSAVAKVSGQKENGELKCGMPEPDITANAAKVAPSIPQEVSSRDESSTSTTGLPISIHPVPVPESPVKHTEMVKKDEQISTVVIANNTPVTPEASSQGQAPQSDGSDAMDIDEPSDIEPAAEAVADETPVAQSDVEMKSESDEDSDDSSEDSSSEESDSSDSEDESSEIEAAPAPCSSTTADVSASSTEAVSAPISQSASGEKPSALPAGLQNPEDSVIIASSNPVEPLPNKFTPYVSPLRILRSYRTNPVFLEEHLSEMPGLKYSTKINPFKEVCRFELNGGICNDSSCTSQHFRDMTAAEDEILVDVADIESVPANLRDTYRDGLYEIIQDLRKRGVRDFKTVAKGILRFRRQWAEKQKEGDKTETNA